MLHKLSGEAFAARYNQLECESSVSDVGRRENELEEYFDANQEGHGIWKWRHYFDIYDRHFNKFRGKPVNVCEIGVYSGGSLGMWQKYFGTNCQMFGVDIEDACKTYENDRTKILIGDQADREFWRDALKALPPLDIVIDDGGHAPHQQIVTLEELLPHMRMGGVYLCEDVHGQSNEYARYTHALADALNSVKWTTAPPEANGGGCSLTTAFQRQIHSIHFYPFVTVIEKNQSEVERFVSPKHGTEWQPFL